AGRHGIVTGVKQSGVQIGAFLAGLVLPGVAGAVGWRPALGGCALLGAAGLVLTWCYVPSPSGEDEPAPGQAADGATAGGAGAGGVGADRVGADAAWNTAEAAGGAPPRVLRRRLDRAVNRL